MVVAEAVAPAGSPVAGPVAGAAPVPGGLGYTALSTPCRAVDTRVVSVTAGDLVPDETRSFQIRGSSSLSSQGGSSSGCGVPATAQAVEVSITAVVPSGANGFLRAFPSGGAVPNATFINYTVGRGITNTGTVPLNTAATQDLGVKNFGGTIHVIVDVQGYFAPTGGSSYVPLTAPCRVVDTRNAGGTLGDSGSRPFQIAGTGPNFGAQGGTVGGCGVPDGVPGVEVSVTVITPIGNGFVRVAPNGSDTSAAFINYTSGTGITNTGSITLSDAAALDVVVRNFGGTLHVAIDVQGYFTGAAGQGTRFQTVTPCRTVDTRVVGGALQPGAVRAFQTAGERVDFTAQGAPDPTGCGIPQQATAVEASVTAVTPTGSGFTRPSPTGSVPAATFLNYTAVGGITNTGSVPLARGGIADLSITNLGGSANYLVDVLGYFEPSGRSPRSAENVEARAGSTCALVGGQQVRCWGSNASGGLGSGGFNTTTQVAVAGIDDAIQVAGSCALRAGGSVSCWGSNEAGQLGIGLSFGDQPSSPTPVDLVGLTGVVQLAAGSIHVCALIGDGTVRCWGSNTSGQLGDGTQLERNAPEPVPGLTGVVRIAAGDDHSCAVLASGQARCWGENFAGQLGDGTTSRRTSPVAVTGLVGVARIAAGDSYTCATLHSGQARCWGDNAEGRLGDGGTTDRPSPVAVLGISSAIDVAASAGGASCAVLADGGGRCWGSSERGQLGDGSIVDRSSPVPVTGLAGSVSVSGGGQGFCAVLADGGLQCWGANDSGQIGDGTTTDRPTPRSVVGTFGAVQVVAGGTHSCALLADGGARCWGNNSGGQLGDGSTAPSNAPVVVSGLTGAVQLAAGSTHTCALVLDTSVRCWGANSFGQLGDSTTSPRSVPVQVSGLAGVVAITAGDAHTCALRRNGVIRCWGLNVSGQIGDGTNTQRNSPVQVAGIAGSTRVTAGAQHTCAAQAGSTGVTCWGSNDSLQLGSLPPDDSSNPRAVPVPDPVFQIAAGGDHSCVIDDSPLVRCWGANDSGQIGDGTVVPTVGPVALREVDVPGPEEIDLGLAHSCASLSDLTVRCWGENGNGQIGDFTTFDRSSPTPVLVLTMPSDLQLSGAVQVEVGNAHSCVATTSGSVRCWGANSLGQLGDGSNLQRTSPVTVTGLVQ